MSIYDINANASTLLYDINGNMLNIGTSVDVTDVLKGEY